jgi:hypothetical protein
MIRKVEQPLVLLLAIMVGITLGTFTASFAQNTTTTSVSLGEQIQTSVTAVSSAIVGAISLILIILKWIESWLKNQKDSAFKTKALEVIGKTKGSLEESDKWIRDTIISHTQDFKTFAEMVSKYPTVQEAYNSPDVQKFFKQLDSKATEAKQEFDRWYNYASTVSGLNSKDPNIAKLAEIETQLTPAGPTPKTDTAGSDAV